MNNDIIRMAREAGFSFETGQDLRDNIPALEHFAALVAAHERERVMNEPLTKAMWDRFESEIRADEREACAVLCEEIDDASYPHTRKWPSDCAAAILARGEK